VAANPTRARAATANIAAASVGGGGTTNFIPIWTHSTTLGNSALFQTGGKVGIGNTTPAATLDVTGSFNLPFTSSSTVEVIMAGGQPFIHNFSSGSENTFVGLGAGNFSMTGFANSAFGWSTLLSDTTGAVNTATGVQALVGNTKGNNNTAVGDLALGNNTTGNFNTVVGYAAGFTGNSANANITGSNNTFIGSQAGPGTSKQLTDATAIGSNALVSESHAMVLGDGTVKVGIGTQKPSAKLHVAGGDVLTSEAGTGLIVKSPNGTKCARIGIDNAGKIVTTVVTCP
jgi:hypothetical protein